MFLSLDLDLTQAYRTVSMSARTKPRTKRRPVWWDQMTRYSFYRDIKDPILAALCSDRVGPAPEEAAGAPHTSVITLCLLLKYNFTSNVVA